MRFRFDVSLYIIVPVIFAGLAALTSTGSFRLTAYLIHRGAEPGWPLLAWTLLMTGAGFACGLVIVRLFLKPVSEFVEKARRLTPLEAIEADPVPDEGGDEVRRYSRVFDRVTRVLSRVDARQQFPEIIGQSRAMRAVLAQIVKVAPTDGTVLIQGESGTGKELVATSICQHSLRQGRPFIKLNCVAIPEGLLESELFGHEKGAFTGATSTQKGRFELADGGTLFLDEIGDMPLETQAKILRVLQEREFEPVGGSRTIKVDVRFIAATNKNLDDLVSQGRFRDDLYYRLNVLSILLPPLRERAEDIPLLAEHFLQQAPRPARISSQALRDLILWSWPGNVRELQNVIERGSVMCDDGLIQPSNLPENMSVQGPANPMASLSSAVPAPLHVDTEMNLDQALAEMEQAMIVESLWRTGGVQARAAELLGIKERSLWHRIKKYGIDVAAIRDDLRARNDE